MLFSFPFTCGCPAVPLQFVEKPILSLPDCLGMPVDNQLAISVEVSSHLCSCPFIYVFILFHFQTWITVALERASNWKV